MYGLLSFPFDLKICNGSKIKPEKSFFISNVGTGITCFPCVCLILLASCISSSVATSVMYIVSVSSGNPKFSLIFFIILSEVPKINMLSGLYFLKAFFISSASWGLLNNAFFTVSILVAAFFAETPAITSFSFIKSPSSII